MANDNGILPIGGARPPALLQRYTPVLEAWYADDGDPRRRQLVPAEDIPAVRQQVVASLQPAPVAERAKAVAVLCGSFKTGDVIQNAEVFARAMIAGLHYPADVLDAAIVQARRAFKWLPSIAEMVEICDRLTAQRRWPLSVLAAMEREHEELRKAEEAGKRRCEERQRLASRCSEVFGADLMPESEQLEAAIDFLQGTGSHEYDSGSGWRGAIERGEPWALVALWRIAQHRDAGVGTLRKMVSDTAFDFGSGDIGCAREALVEAGLLPDRHNHSRRTA